MRDLTRAREDMKGLERITKQRLNAFLLRHGHHYPQDKCRWTQAHSRWLEGLKFEAWCNRLCSNVDAVKQAEARVWSRRWRRPYRIGPWPQWWWPYDGLAGGEADHSHDRHGRTGGHQPFCLPAATDGLPFPREYSSGQTRRRGGITKTGNSHVRRVLVEAAWGYRFPARKTAHLQRRAEQTSEAVQAIAWKAQKRLCGRYRHCCKLKVQACTAVARELAGFIWAIVCEMNAPLSGHRKPRTSSPSAAR